jgi:gliding motility-associated-like protein
MNFLMRLFLVTLILTAYTNKIYGQGLNCLSAEPFCSDSPQTFPAQTGAGPAQPGPNYGCLFTQPNAAWYFLQVGQSGNIIITLTPSPLVDIDFILWGPFPDPTSPCVAQLTAGNTVSCSYSSQAVETATIPNGQVGEFYILLITNFSNQPTNINVTQTGGSGSTDCSILIPCQLEVDAGPGGAVCVGEPIQFNGSHQNEEGNVTFQWTSNPAGAINDLDDPTILNPTFTPSQNYGTVTFTLTVTDDGPNLGPCSISDNLTVTFRPLPTIAVNPNICPGADAVFTITGSPGDEITYEINGQQGTITLGPSGTATVTASNVSASQTLAITGGNLGICPLTSNDLAAINPATANMSPIAIDTLLQFQADCGIPNGAVSGQVSGLQGTPVYNWTGPGPNNPNFINASVWQNLPSGWYYFTVNDGQCSLTDSIFLEQTPPPTAAFTANPQVGNAPLNVTFVNNSQGASSYFWDFANGATNSLNNTSSQNQTYTEEGNYLVMLVATEGACSDTAYQVVVVNLVLPLSFDMPNIFTPNGDGSNDVFTINPENAESLEMVVLNRWGNVVYESNELNMVWNGRNNNTGEPCAPGTYFYKFTITDLYGERQTHHGFVHLVRD